MYYTNARESTSQGTGLELRSIMDRELEVALGKKAEATTAPTAYAAPLVGIGTGDGYFCFRAREGPLRTHCFARARNFSRTWLPKHTQSDQTCSRGSFRTVSQSQLLLRVYGARRMGHAKEATYPYAGTVSKSHTKSARTRARSVKLERRAAQVNNDFTCSSIKSHTCISLNNIRNSVR